MDKSTYGNLSKGKSVAHFGSHVLTANDFLTNLKAIGGDDVSLRAVNIVKKSDISRTVRIVLDALYYSLDIVLVSLEIAETQCSLMAAATIAGAERAA